MLFAMAWCRFGFDMKMDSILAHDRVFVGVKASSKKQLLHLIAGHCARSLKLDPKKVLAGLLEREALVSTGVGSGVATPHVRLHEIDTVTGFFFRLETPVDFDAVDDAKVCLVFALLTPFDAGAEHLKALAQVSRTLRLPQIRKRLLAAPDADACRIILCSDIAASSTKPTRQLQT